MEIHVCRVRLRTLGVVRFDGFPGIALRGALGEELRAARLFGGAYERLFRPRGEGLPKRFRTPPPPLVLRPRFGPGSYAAGSALELELTLCGPSHRELPALLAGLARLGAEGIGEERHRGPAYGTFAIERAELLTPRGALSIPDAATGGLALPAAPWRFPEDFATAAPDAERESFTVRLRSPTLLDKAAERAGAEPVMWSFAELVRALAARLSLLSLLYGERHLLERAEAETLVAAAAAVREEDRCCALHQLPRYSTRQRREMLFAGWTGYVRYAGSPAPWLPLLRAASLLHVGRHCTFGWGEVTLA